MQSANPNNGGQNLTPWKPGKSGNPSGRPKRDVQIAELARTYTELAVNTLVDIMQDKAAADSARVNAASAILDRGWGKAPQSLDCQHRLTLADEFELYIRSLGADRVVDGAPVESAERGGGYNGE